MQPELLLLLFIAVIGALGAVLLLAMARLTAATRRANRGLSRKVDDAALVTAALGEAVTQIREPERATHARAAASECLSQQIIASLSSGLLVVGVAGDVKILNPVGSRLLGLEDEALGRGAARCRWSNVWTACRRDRRVPGRRAADRPSDACTRSVRCYSRPAVISGSRILPIDYASRCRRSSAAC